MLHPLFFNLLTNSFGSWCLVCIKSNCKKKLVSSIMKKLFIALKNLMIWNEWGYEFVCVPLCVTYTAIWILYLIAIFDWIQDNLKTWFCWLPIIFLIKMYLPRVSIIKCQFDFPSFSKDGERFVVTMIFEK